MNLMTLEIPRSSWPDHFRGLIDTHEGWGVTIEVLDQELGDQLALHGLTLRGMTLESKGSAAGDILIEAGDAPDFSSYRIHQPRVIRVVQTRPGLEADLQIESLDGTTTLVLLRSRTALPPADLP
jgi:hypothetical protein